MSQEEHGCDRCTLSDDEFDILYERVKNTLVNEELPDPLKEKVKRTVFMGWTMALKAAIRCPLIRSVLEDARGKQILRTNMSYGDFDD